jgi:hypothetical protein
MFIFRRLFHRTCIYRLGVETFQQYQKYHHDQMIESFSSFAILALQEIQAEIQNQCYRIQDSLGLNRELIYDENINQQSIENIIDEKIACQLEPSPIIPLLESTIIDLSESKSFAQLFENNHGVTSSQMWNEYFFFGNFDIPLTSFRTFPLPPSTGEVILDSLNENGKTNGWVINSAITDFGKILKEDCYPENSYHDVDTLQRLLNGERKKVFDSTSKKIYLPYLEQAHYTLFVINLENTEKIRIYYYNSLQSIPCPINFERIYQILKNNLKPTRKNYEFPKEFIGYEPDCPQQSNNKDCGIYTMLNMIHRSAGIGEGKIHYTYKVEMRKYIADSLKRQSIIPKLIVEINKKVVKMNENESD